LEGGGGCGRSGERNEDEKKGVERGGKGRRGL